MNKLSTYSWSILTLIVGIMFLSGCTGSSGTPQGTQPQKIESQSATETSTAESKKETQKFKIGETIKLGDYIISVTNLEDPFLSKNEYFQPEAGNKLVAVEVSYENNTTDKQINYNPYDWKLFDSEGYNFETGFVYNKEPKLSSGNLNPGGKAKGWVTFEVPENANDFKLQFTPDFWDTDNVEIELY